MSGPYDNWSHLILYTSLHNDDVIRCSPQLADGAGASTTRLSQDKTLLTFTSSNWNIAQTVTITAVNDYTARGADTFYIDFQVLSGDAGVYPLI